MSSRSYFCRAGEVRVTRKVRKRFKTNSNEKILKIERNSSKKLVKWKIKLGRHDLSASKEKLSTYIPPKLKKQFFGVKIVQFCGMIVTYCKGN